MKTVTVSANWSPRKGFSLGKRDIKGVRTYSGSKVWTDLQVAIQDKPMPEPDDDEVIIRVHACGICGSDVHMAQPDDDGYIWYPGLTGFPCTLGHELSGVVVEAGPGVFNKATNKPYQGGEWVCAEEMLWCGACKPCADGWPNHCERLDEIGFNVEGAFTRYIVLPSKVLWSLDPLREALAGGAATDPADTN